jgi:23S rRNA pseudouridine1911/1915/1917 synthase
MDIPIIYEDEHVIAVNKPTGLVVHSDGRTKEPTLADWVHEKYPHMRDVGEPLVLATGEHIARPGIVHRLDRDTSGVLVIAKDQPTFLFLKKQFQDRDTEKIYRAFVYGNMKEEKGVIDLPIGKSKKDFRQRLAGTHARGTLRSAITEYKVLERSTDAAYLEVYPKTGRTHQIRVHLKAIQHPVIHDTLYAPNRPGILGFERLALHALKISVALPSGARATFEAPLPPDFEQAAEKLKKAAEPAN